MSVFHVEVTESSNNVDVSEVGAIGLRGPTGAAGSTGATGPDYFRDGTGTLNTEYDFRITGHSAFGNDSAIDQDWDGDPELAILDVREVFTTGGATALAGQATRVTVNPSSELTGGAFSLNNSILTDPGNTENISSLEASYNEFFHQGSGTVNSMIGLDIWGANIGAGNITSLYGAIIDVGSESTATGNIGTLYGLDISIYCDGGTIDTGYGIYVHDTSSSATGAWNIFSEGSTSRNLMSNVYGATGSAGDLHLYSTSHATKGKIYFGDNVYFDEANNQLLFPDGDTSNPFLGRKTTPTVGFYYRGNTLINQNLQVDNSYPLLIRSNNPGYWPGIGMLVAGSDQIQSLLFTQGFITTGMIVFSGDFRADLQGDGSVLITDFGLTNLPQGAQIAGVQDANAPVFCAATLDDTGDATKSYHFMGRMRGLGQFGIPNFDISCRGDINIYDSGTLGSECFQEGNFSTHAKWDVTNDFDDTGGNATYLHSLGVGTLTQTSVNLSVALKGNRWYQLTYTISGKSGNPIAYIPDTVAQLVRGESGQEGNDRWLRMDNYAGKKLMFKTIAAPTNFLIAATSTTAGDTFVLDDLSLKEIQGGDISIMGNLDASTGFFWGTSDTHQLIVKANSTQTENIMEIQNNAGTVLAGFNSSGSFLCKTTTAMYEAIAGTIGSDSKWEIGDSLVINRFQTCAVGTKKLRIRSTGASDAGALLSAEDENGNDVVSLMRSGDVLLAGVLKVDGVQVVSNRIIDARIDDVINSGDATTDGVIDAIVDCLVAHGLIAAA